MADSKIAIKNELYRIFINEKQLKILMNCDFNSVFTFYQALFKLWKLALTNETIYHKQEFVKQAALIYVLNPLTNPDIKKVTQQLTETTTLLTVAVTQKEFRQLFKRKYQMAIPNLDKYYQQDIDDKLSDFDIKMRTFLHFN